MDTIQSLSLAMGSAWTSGINLYATVAVLGLAEQAGMIHLPPGLEPLSNPGVIAIALVMYVVEFFADKVPYVDTGWDTIHTFIRIPAGALLAARAIGPTDPALEVAALLAGGTVALAAHGTKATARLAINASPEPFTNWIASVTEDVVAVGGLWMAFNHPVVMLVFVLGFVALAVYLIPKILRALRTLFRKVFGKREAAGAATTPPTPVASP